MFRQALVTVLMALAAFAQVADPAASLADLVRRNPGAALRQLAAEEPHSFQGTLSTLTMDNPATGVLETRTTLQIGDDSYAVYSEQPIEGGCKQSATVRGYQIGDQILAASIEGTGPLSSPACLAGGVQKTLTILLHTPTVQLPSHIIPTFVQSYMTGATAPTVNGYFQEVSKGITSVSSDTVGPFTLAAEPGCVTNTALVLSALSLAAPGTDLTLYNRIIVVAPRTQLCPSRVYSNNCVSLNSPDGVLVASWSYVSSDVLTTAGAGVSLAAKAIGNGIGLGWSYTRDYSTVPLGAFGPGGTDLLEDEFAIMGGFQSHGGVFPVGHMPTRQKVNLGWAISGVDFLNVQANSTNTILPASSPTPGIKALRIRRGTGYNEWLWVEHRQFVGPYDSTLQNYAPTLAGGVLVYHERPTDLANYTYLLHFKPVAAPNGFQTAMMLAGTQWDDPSSNLTLQVSSVATGMQVTATYRPTGGCTYVPSPTTLDVSSAAGTTGFAVATGPYCEWFGSTTAPFITITTPFGTGNGTVALSYLANGTGVGRSATIDLSGQTVTLNQGSGVAGILQISGKTTLSAAALAGVTLTLSGVAAQTAISNASGDYALTGLAAGTYTVTPKLLGYSFAPASTTFPSMSANQVANFAATKLPALLTLDRTRLNYAARSTTVLTPSQRVLLDFGGGTAAWTASTNQAWLQVTPASGTGPARLTVSLVPGSLPPSGTAIATLTVSAPTATPASKTVTVYLTRLTSSVAAFGVFDTPVNNATNVTGSIPVTGWAVDDIYVSKVQIYRDPLAGEATQPNGFVYIGDALFVPNTRSDIEGFNPTLPFQYRGGWGYMMLTNAVYNPSGAQGNGTIKLWAIATDIEGNTTNLGSKVITLNNANAKLPFGAIDTPGQGGTAAGAAFRNDGWAMTPQPNIISLVPTNITVYVDSMPIGRATYNQVRGDIVGLFPGYRNSSAAGAFFDFDTTQYTNGQHTIAWLVYDDAGNGDGIGSRFFSIENGVSGGVAGNPAPPVAMELMEGGTERVAGRRPRRGAVPQQMTVQEMARLAIPLPDGQWTGAHVINGELRPLPVGSTLDNASGAFYWHLGAGFLGPQELLFTSSDGAVHGVTVNIQPKTYGEEQ
jgi:hypothetical protein